MMIFLLEIHSKIGITGAALLCLAIDFFSTSAAGILIVPIFSSSCYIVYTPDPEESEKIFRSVTLHGYCSLRSQQHTSQCAEYHQ